MRVQEVTWNLEHGTRNLRRASAEHMELVGSRVICFEVVDRKKCDFDV